MEQHLQSQAAPVSGGATTTAPAPKMGKKKLSWPRFKAAPGSEEALQEEVAHLRRNEAPVVDHAPTHIVRNEYGALNDAHDARSAGRLHDKGYDRNDF